MTMLTHWISILLQFTLRASDPSWTCELARRDPGVAGAYYLYCAQTTPDGVELVDVGRFVSDEPAREAHESALTRGSRP